MKASADRRRATLLLGLWLVAAAASHASPPMPPPRLCVASRCVDTQVSTSPSGTTTSLSATTTATTTSTSGIKFHPGHYAWLDGVPLVSTISTVKARHFSQIAEICANPEIRGVQVHLSWALLERGGLPGDYSAGFALVDEYLARLGPCGKYLMLAVHERWFGGFPGAADVLPAYLLTSAYGPVSPRVGCDVSTGGLSVGGAVMSNGSSCNWTGGLALMAKLWDPRVMDRLIALARAYGARYDRHPGFEMFLPTEESAIAVPAALGYGVTAYVSQARRLYAATRTAWPTTALRYKQNYLASDGVSADLMASLVDLKVVIGGPDVIPTENIQANKVFTNQPGTFRDHRGIVPFAAEVQSPSLGGKEGSFTPAQLFDHSMDGNSRALATRPQYFIWYYNTWAGGTAQRWSTGIKPYIVGTLRGAIGNGLDGQRTPPAQVPCPRGYTAGCRR